MATHLRGSLWKGAPLAEAVLATADPYYLDFIAGQEEGRSDKLLDARCSRVLGGDRQAALRYRCARLRTRLANPRSWPELARVQNGRDLVRSQRMYYMGPPVPGGATLSSHIDVK